MLNTFSSSIKLYSTFLYFDESHFPCFKLRSCCALICLIGILKTIVLRPVKAHKVLTTDESTPPDIPTTNAWGENDDDSQ